MSPDELHRFVAGVLGVDPARVHEDLGYGDILEWDSVHHVEIVLALEERLGIEIGPEQIVELTPVSVIEEFVAAHSSGAAD